MEPAREIGCEPVLRSLADVADMGVQPCQLRLGFPASGRALFLATQAVGQALLVLEQRFVRLRAGNGEFLRRERSEIGYARPALVGAIQFQLLLLPFQIVRLIGLETCA